MRQAKASTTERNLEQPWAIETSKEIEDKPERVVWACSHIQQQESFFMQKWGRRGRSKSVWESKGIFAAGGS